MTVWRLFVLSMAIPLAAMAIAVSVAIPRSDAVATVDMSGTWELTVRGLAAPDLDEECTAVVTQDASTMTIDLDCERSGDLRFAGERSTGKSFSVVGEFFGFDMILFGGVDGDTMSGNFSWRDGWGSFVADRVLPDTPTRTPTPIGPFDLSGDWSLMLDGSNFPPPATGGSLRCTVYLETTNGNVMGAAWCEAFGTMRAEGTADLSADTFTLALTTSSGTTISLNGSRNDRGNPVGSYTLSMFGDAVNQFGMSRDTPIGWGELVCFDVPYTPHGPTSRRITGSAAALVVLQFQARVSHLGQGSCSYILDVNLDSRTNALDAMLILQNEAGLISRLPVL